MKYRASWAALAFQIGAAGCSSDGAPPADAGVVSRACPVRTVAPCPAGWVRHETGGCGPAVVLCTRGGGAAVGACDGVDVTSARAESFHVTTDGTVGGAWTAAAERAGRGAPAEDYVPVTGISRCPSAWAMRTDGTCDPRFGTTCGAGSVALPGGQCTRTGMSECPAGTWPALPPEAAGARVLYVQASASAEGADGTVEHPYPTLVGALQQAPAGAWVVLAEGVYAESFTLARSMHILGACAARVVVSLPAGSPYTVAITGSGAGVTLDLAGLTARGGGVRASGGARVIAQRVRVEDAVTNGLVAAGQGSSVTATDVVVTRTTTAGTTLTHAVAVTDGASATLTRVALTQVAGVGIFATGQGSSADVSDVVIGPSTASARQGAAGVLVGLGARATFARGVLRDLPSAGFVVAQAGTSATLEDVVVQRARTSLTENTAGVMALDGASLRVTRALVEGCTWAGLRAAGMRANLDAREVVVRGGVAAPSGAGGYGLMTDEGATLTASAARVEDDNEAGVYADHGSRIEVDGIIVRATRSDRGTGRGYGIAADRASTITVAHALVEQNHTVGVGAIQPGSELTITDAVIRDTDSPVGARGFGLVADERATVTARRVRIASSYTDGVSAQHEATLTIEDAVVAGTLPSSAATGVSGNGLDANQATLRATRVRVEGNAGAGVLATNGARAEIAECVVRGTSPTPETPVERQRGFGVVATSGATLGVSATTIEDNTRTGVHAEGEGTTFTLTDSAVLATRPGANGEGGLGTTVIQRARLVATRTLWRSNRQVGVFVAYRGRAELTDALVLDTLPEARGMGVGISVGAATLQGTRVAVVGANGAGFALLGSNLAASAVVDGLFVRGVAAERVGPPGTGALYDRRVAYGIFVATNGSMTVAGATLDRCEWGFFQSLSELTLQNAVISRQSVAMGVTNGAIRAPEVSALASCGNRQEAVLRDVVLPEVRLPPPPEL